MSRSRIKSLIESGDIVIEPFSEDLLTPNGYDLSLSSNVYRMREIDRVLNPLRQENLQVDYLEDNEEADDAEATEDGDHDPAEEPSPRFLKEDDTTGEIRLEPLEPVSVLSRECVGLAPSLMATVQGRSSLGQLGVFPHLNSGIIDAGFGADKPQPIVFTLMSCNPNPVVLHPGQPIAQLLVHSIETPSTGRTQYSQYEISPAPDFSDLPGQLIDDGFVIGIIGMPAAGKTDAAKVLAEMLDGEYHKMGKIVREAAETRGYDPDEDLHETSIELREEYGPDVIAKRLIEDLKGKTATYPRVIEGIRSPAEIETLREKLSARFVLLGVHSNTSTRHERWAARDRGDDDPSKFAMRDEKEREFGVPDALTMSDYIITNEGSLPEFIRQVEEVLALILSKN